jgi:uncharacterized protein (DUF1330 family)
LIRPIVAKASANHDLLKCDLAAETAVGWQYPLRRNEMTVYAISQSQTTDQEALDAYIALAVTTLEAHNVKVLALDDSPTNIEGAIERARTVILEFSDTAAFYAWYDSPEYQSAKKHRLNASIGTFILVEGI